MTNATVSVMDATGTSVTSSAAVSASGSYGPVTLTGTAPYRLAACGNSVDKYTCLFSVAQAGGTVNITPLTSAIVLLASGVLPMAPLSGAVQGLGASAVAAAQSQLQTALAAALSDAGLAANADLISTAFTAGSGTGYDRLLDGLSVSLGQDATPFVEIDARLGSGSVNLSTSSSSGSLSIASGAASLDLSGLPTLFTAMTAAMANANACDPGPTTGMEPLMDSSARMTVGGINFNGSNVAFGLCNLLGPVGSAGGLFADGSLPYASKLLSPQLGRCDFTGVRPVCRVALIAQTPTKALVPMALNQAVAYQGSGSWLFYGDMQPFPASADARAQRLRRVDGGAQVDSYASAIGVSVSTQFGAACAKVTQKDSGGNNQLLAYLQPASGSPTWMSVLNVDTSSNQVSTNPSTGVIRGPDDRWIPLPSGTAGDAIIRNFNAGGHSVQVALFSDSLCTTPFTPTGGSAVFSLDLPAVPPLSAALSNLPWPSLSTASATTLSAFNGATGAKPSYSASWTLPSPPPAMSSAQLCTDSLCSIGTGTSPSLVIGSLAVAPAGLTASVPTTIGTPALAATDFKQVRLNARNGDGLLLNADFQSCSSVTAGFSCAVSLPQAMRVVGRRGTR